MLKKFLIVSAALLVSTAQMHSQAGSAEITVDELRDHVKYLASDELQGRGSGTEGNQKAAEYIAEQFTQYGLKPAGDNGTYFQTFDFVSALKLGTANSFSLATKKGKPQSLKLDQDYRPLGFSSNAKVSGPLVFAGYGITAPEKSYNDYADLNVKNTIVVVLRYGPDGADTHSDFYKHSSYRRKAQVARENGAIGLILVDGTDDDLLKLKYDQSFASSGIAAVNMKRSILDSWLQPMKKSVKAIQDSIKSAKQPITFAMPGITATLETDVEKVTARTANVLGYVEGNSAELKDQVVIVGAHFDHLGHGGEGSLAPDSRDIHNGADDNASGTAAMLELAEKFAAEKSTMRRTMLFVGFSGEELGTLGSQYYVNNPHFPLEKTTAMLNMDMIGRMKDNTLTVSGVGTSPLWNDVVKKWNSGTDTINIKTTAEGFGPSDHGQFYNKNIPVLFFFTGNHPDYHKPSDDWEKLNLEGEQRVARLVHSIAQDVQSRAERPLFAKTQTPAGSTGGGDGRGFSVTLGVVPDYSATVEGMKIDGTRAGGPAEKAGLKSGDVITKLAGKKVLNIYDYMGILGELKSGDVVEVEVTRDGQSMKFSATMQKR